MNDAENRKSVTPADKIKINKAALAKTIEQEINKFIDFSGVEIGEIKFRKNPSTGRITNVDIEIIL